MSTSLWPVESAVLNHLPSLCVPYKSHLLFNSLSLPLVSAGITSNRSEREVRGAGLVLQTVWGYKELRRTLEKEGWKKTHFMVNLNPPSNNTRANGGYEDSTLPLIDKGQERETHARKVYCSARPNKCNNLSLMSGSKSSVSPVQFKYFLYRSIISIFILSC